MEMMAGGTEIRFWNKVLTEAQKTKEAELHVQTPEKQNQNSLMIEQKVDNQ